MKYLIAFLLLFFGIEVFSQQYSSFRLEGRIRGYPESKLVLNRVIGHKELKIRDIITDKGGTFDLLFNEALPSGFYRLRVDQPNRRDMINLLISEKIIGLVTHIDYFADSARFSGSSQNISMHEYMRLKGDYEARLSILEHLLSIYPADKRFYPQIVSEINTLQDELIHDVDKITSRFPGTLLTAYIRSDLEPRFNPAFSAASRQEYVMDNFLNDIDFLDTLLLYSDLFPNKAISYIMLHRNQAYDRVQQADAFIKGVDKLLQRTLIEPKVFNFILEYLISGFEQIGSEEVLTHIANNYEALEQCITDKDSGELQRRIEGYKRLAEGKPAPTIDATDINGKPFILASIKADNILLFFYASWCPYCTAMLPRIKELAIQVNADTLAANQPRLTVLAVSIDVDQQAYKDLLQKNSLEADALKNFWFNHCDFRGWEGKVANDYYLYATPTLILLDRNLNIKKKPSGVEELKALLNR
ncbi:MAG: thioredoxin-like domain-containing protein [Bacteroidales bacterium]|nr:thioredoxin-like domain-containing protein [Bacteroidales bacterium]MDZ4205228.1 thioredoxin-like domain-containing protein [Bacteroidales bacterium]